MICVSLYSYTFMNIIVIYLKGHYELLKVHSDLLILYLAIDFLLFRGAAEATPFEVYAVSV